MTLFWVTVERCAVCNALNFHQSLESTNARSSDLDSRPVGMARGTMSLWVHRCRKCGYCASRLGHLLPQAEKTVFTEEFQQLKESRKYPELTKKFLSVALVLEKSGHYLKASSRTLEAAWVCDDKKQIKLAKECRTQAIHLFMKSRDLGYQDSDDVSFDDEGTQEVILADMLRRTGRFEEAKRIVQEGHLKHPSEKIVKMLNYQLNLTQIQDLAAHSIEEIDNPKVPIRFRDYLGCIVLFGSVLAYYGLYAYFIFNNPNFVNIFVIIFGGVFGGIAWYMLSAYLLERLAKVNFDNVWG